MFDFLITGLLVLLPLLMILKIIRDWRKNKNNWLWLPVAFFVLAALEFILNWWNGLLAFIFALFVYVIVGRVTRK